MISFEKSLMRVALVALFMSISPALQAEVSSDITTAPSGTYAIDPAHTRVSFKISHMGFSYYTGRFDTLEGQLALNNTEPGQSTLDVTIDVNSLDLGDSALEEDLRGANWFNVIQYPHATFHATKIERTGAITGTITGDLTLMDTTHSVILDAVLIGTGRNPLNGKQVIGFNASGVIRRSDFHLTNLVPIIGDDVTLEINAEFDQMY